MGYLDEGPLAVLAALDTSELPVLVMTLLPRPSVRFPGYLVLGTVFLFLGLKKRTR